MTKAVFIASSHSAYQDRPGEVYHFPNSYLTRVAQTVGDWVIYFEGRRGGSRGYYAVQRVAPMDQLQQKWLTGCYSQTVD
jgi:putative restriction endonuclease